MAPEIDESAVEVTPQDLRDVWRVLSVEERTEGFKYLPRDEADDFFLSLTALEQADILQELPPRERRLWMRLLPPDDAADVLQEAPDEMRSELLALLDEQTRREVTVLLAYEEDDAGGLMNPRFFRVRPEMTVDEAISYLRRQARTRLETTSYAYVLDSAQHLEGVVSFRELFASAGDERVSEVMEPEVVTVAEDMDQEAVARIVSRYDFLAVPVVGPAGRMKGIVTVDDIVDVVQEEATEDMHKLGGMEALDAPYFQTGFFAMVRKRAVWLAVLFLGELLTANAVRHYEDAIAAAVVLTVFMPLIISSGGNSGSQASTLIIRAMALGEVRLRDWWRVIYRELASGVALGTILAVLGLSRVVLGESVFGAYGEHYLPLAFTVGLSLIGVVTWGTLCGSMLPFLLRRLRLDPASASAPFVATLVDVSGLVIYFSVAQIVLRGRLL